MKRRALMRHLRRHGCRLLREGGDHAMWINPRNGAVQAVPRHAEVNHRLARSICRKLSVPEPTGT